MPEVAVGVPLSGHVSDLQPISEPPVPADGARPRRFPPRTLRGRLIWSAAAVAVLAVLTAGTILVVDWRTYEDALAEYTTAREERDALTADVAEADADLADVRVTLVDVRDAVTAMIAGEPEALGDAAAEQELVLVRDEVAEAFAEDLAAVDLAAEEQAEEPTDPDAAEPDVTPTPTPTPAATRPAAEVPSSTEDLRAATTRLRDESAGLTDDRDDRRAHHGDLEEAVDSLEQAAVAYGEALAPVGDALLEDRADAADDVKAALRAVLDQLPGADFEETAMLTGEYFAAASAVVASSDAARAPVQSSKPGSIDEPTSITVVVNKRRSLASSYVPPDLVVPTWSGAAGLPLRAEAARAVEVLAADAAAAGISLRSVSSYRSYARQEVIHNGYVAREGVAGADTHSARPGHSEHQTGLVVDFDDGAGCSLSTCFANTAGGQWLVANAYRYGFILRYPNGLQHIVGYSYEPWHYRYVGVETATAMHTGGIATLEEYFGLPAAPDYG